MGGPVRGDKAARFHDKKDFQRRDRRYADKIKESIRQTGEKETLGGSIDTMLSGKSAKEETPHEVTPPAEETSDGFDEVRSAYEKRLAEMQESYEKYIESLKKDKSVLFTIACVLTAFLVLFLIMDLALGSVGWIRY